MKVKALILLTLVLLLVGIPGFAQASGNVVRTSGDIVIEAGQRVYGDIIALQGDVHIYGEVNGDVVALLGTVYVYEAGIIRGDAVVLAGQLQVEEGGQIHGDRVSLGISDLGGLRIRPHNLFRFNQINLGQIIFRVMFRIALGLLVVALFPFAVRRGMAQVQTAPGASVGFGFLVWLVALPLLLILIITIIGILLAVPLILILYLAGVFGGAALDLLLGEAILKRPEQPFASVALGGLIFGLLRSIPLVGLLVSLGMSLVALGAVVQSRFGTLKTEIV